MAAAGGFLIICQRFPTYGAGGAACPPGMPGVPERAPVSARSTPRRRPMPRLTVFNSPLLLGFDHFERILDRASKVQADGYPPYNVEQTSESSLRLTLAVAGFSIDDLSL